MAKCAVCKGSGLLLDWYHICPLCDGIYGWPESLPTIRDINLGERVRFPGAMSREIRAIHDERTVRVYQAYNVEIAEAAVGKNSFRAPLEAGLWSPTRMTWIKPSAVWMAYRCGWSVMKDKNQARVLALDLCKETFIDMLMTAQLSHDRSLQPGALRNCPVVVQWDPERVIVRDPSEHTNDVYTRGLQEVRSIQIGLRGAGSEMLLDPTFVLQITDVTDTFRKAHAWLADPMPDVDKAVGELWPREQEVRMMVPLKLRSVLRMDEVCSD